MPKSNIHHIIVNAKKSEFLLQKNILWENTVNDQFLGISWGGIINNLEQAKTPRHIFGVTQVFLPVLKAEALIRNYGAGC